MEGSRGRTQLFVESYRLARDRVDHLKDAYNSHVLQALPRIAGLLESDHDALALLANANSVDYRMPWLQARPLEGVAYRAHIDPAAVEAIRGARRFVVLLDNAGEAVIDLAYALLKASQGVRVTVVARSMEYETDVTLPEARRLAADVAEALGLDSGLVQVLGTGSDYPAPIRGRLGPEAEGAIEEADVVLSKGIANLEALMEECWPEPGKTIVALKAKCPPIARELGVRLGDAVARLGYRCRLRG